jgi:hypothetical protein
MKEAERRTKLLNHRVGLWTVLEKRAAGWLCRCECGTERVYAGGRISAFTAQSSCGCQRRCTAIDAKLDLAWLRANYTYEPETGYFYRNGPKPSSFGREGKYRKVRIKNRQFQQHRVIWFYVTGNWPVCIDHINHDKSDNRLENLRETTRALNSRYAHRPIGKSGFRGVREGHNGGFFAQLRLPNGKFLKSQNVTTAKEAAQIYDQFANQYVPGFAILNFPAQGEQNV